MPGLLRRFLLPAVAAALLTPVAATAPAAAQGVELDLSGRKPQLRLVDPDEERMRRDEERRRADERDFRRRDPDEMRRCSADQALDKAERMGVRRARVTSMGRRFIEVSGRRYGERVEITFARDRRCSIVD